MIPAGRRLAREEIIRLIRQWGRMLQGSTSPIAITSGRRVEPPAPPPATPQPPPP